MTEIQETVGVNRKYRDRLFRLRFGSEESEAITKLRLSDAFINSDKSGDFEWTALVYNLNRGKNDDLLKRCKPLADYMELVNRIRDNQQSGMKVEEAISKAVDSCIADGIMKAFLEKHKSEVLSVCITEFDEKVYRDDIREEGRVEGRAEGIADMTISLLEDIGEVPEALSKIIYEQNDINILEKWHKTAAKAQSIEEFEQKIGLVEK